VNIFCRSLLFDTFKITPDISNTSDCIDSFQSLIEKREFIPEFDNEKGNIHPYLIHYLAVKGIFFLRFSEREMMLNYLKNKKISSINSNAIKIEFAKFSYYESLPDAPSLMNELIGIPVPLIGIDTIFQGGLLTNSKKNLVIGISGQPGSGKTSFALALAASMAPLGTITHLRDLFQIKKTQKLKRMIYF